MNEQRRRTSQWIFRRRSLLALAVALLLGAAGPTAAVQGELAPSAAHEKTTLALLSILGREHYSKKAIDDEFSQHLLRRYLDALDPYHALFLASESPASSATTESASMTPCARAT